jgi:ribosomal protein S18 acetylase RimI-like enzyme
VTLLAARSLARADLVALFNASYCDYLVPLAFDAPAFARHLADNDIDLGVSRVVMAGGDAARARLAAFALLGRRGEEGWIGGVGTVPSHRRRGLGERALMGTLDHAVEAGVTTVWLESLEGNTAAIAMYTKLGFAITRELRVWALAPRPRPVAPSRRIPLAAARAWIAGRRRSREPWQRSDASLDRMRAGGVPLHAVAVTRAEEIAAAAVCAEAPATVRVLQLAAIDEAAMADVLGMAGGGHKALRLVNFPADELLDGVLAELGARLDVLQYEMRWSVAGVRA